MTVVLLALVALGIAAMVATHITTVRLMEKRDRGRQEALYKQHKAAMQDVARVNRSAELAIGNAHAVMEDARLMHARVDGFFAQPQVKQLLRGA